MFWVLLRVLLEASSPVETNDFAAVFFSKSGGKPNSTLFDRVSCVLVLLKQSLYFIRAWQSPFLGGEG